MTTERVERLERWLDRLRSLNEQHAMAAATYEKLEHLRKVVLAAQMQEAEARGVGSVAAQERDARASPQYAEHLGKLFEARLEMERARSAIDAMKLAASLRQSDLASERTEMRAYPST